ncbi:hypothetical protein COUCH_01205 [Couchioplanes caeruleus]|uniref:hypothetical protein n=1 Tax=Couchioplanes caeruleus TaxID=56438 RepID=UPI0020BF4A94|nr:hypothetical protein [Couchioplanes caeruleus]UQU65009.1 hypothetical protein COUCH_01205 [Couchioplanes caeruleus]
MDQREWDYGARLPRERSAAEPWSTRESPESPDSSQIVEPGAPVWGTGSVADTGSMQPIPEAVAWSLRAEAWAQNEDQAVERSGSGTVSRWSDVAATGRPPIPADGVGWRTSTAEWRSTDSARWRQTTEWRSASGTHGWRTTTEAWQSGDANGFVPPVEPPTRLPAISGTAWPTPESGDPPTPSWQQPSTPDDTPGWRRDRSAPEASPSWQQRPADAAPSWQQPADAARSWQQPADATPSWQQRPADAAPPWERPADPTPSWQRAEDPPPTWQQRPADAAPSWQRPADPAPTWQQRPADAAPAWQQQPADATPSWQQRPADAAPSWQAAEDRPSWQQFAAPSATPPTPPPPTPTWQQPADAPRPSWDGRPSWQQFTDTGRSSRRENGTSREAPADRPAESSPGWQDPQPPTAYTGTRSAPGTFDDGRHLVREDDRAQWRRQSGFDDGSRQVGRRRAAEPGSRTSGGTGWTVHSDADNWAGHTDTGSIPAFQDPVADSPSWRRDADDQPDSWRTTSTTNSWQSSAPTTGSRRGVDETGTGWRAQDPDRDGRRSAEPPADSWRSGDQTRDGRRDTGSWRRDPEPGPASDPWAQSASETGVIPLPLQPRERDGGGWQSRTDTGSWQRDTGTRPGDGGRRSRADRTDTGSWQREIESGARSEPGSWQRDDDDPDTGTRQRGGRRSSWQPDDEARTDSRSDTGSWRRDDEPRGRTDTGSWQREAEGTRGRRAARPRGPETQREPRRGLDAQRGAGIPRREGPAAYARRREPDTSWTRELESGAWHRDPESDVWLRDSDTGQWHRAEVEDDEDDEDDRDDDGRPRRGPRSRTRDDVPGGPLELESGEPRRRRRTEDDDRPGSAPQGGGRPGVGRRRAPEGPLQLGAAPETPLDPEVYRRDGDAATRPILGGRRELEPGPAAWQRDAGPADRPNTAPTDRPVSAAPGGWDVAAAPGGWDVAADRPVSAVPDDRPVSAAPTAWQQDRREPPPVSSPPAGPATQPGYGQAAVRPVSSQPGPGQTPARPVSSTPTRPVSSQPGAWRPEAQAAARTDSWRSQMRAEDGIAAGPAPTEPAARTDAWRSQMRAESGLAADPAPGEAAARTDAWRSQMRAEDGIAAGPAPGEAATEIRPAAEAAPWQQRGREQTAPYREAGTADWRRELKESSDLADGESRRFGTSDFVPFRPPSKNGASASVKVPAANSASASATEIIRTGASWQDPPDTEWPPRGAVMTSPAGTYERRPVSTLSSAAARQNDLLEPEEELEEDTGGPLAAVGYTVVWYGVPVVLFVLYMLVLNGAQQAHALSTLAAAAPQFGLSLVLSMLVAVGLRWASGSWKAASVGLAAAVMGGGLATVLTSAITGQSLS